MKAAAMIFAVIGPLCALCAYLFHAGHPVAGAWVIVALFCVHIKSNE